MLNWNKVDEKIKELLKAQTELCDADNKRKLWDCPFHTTIHKEMIENKIDELKREIIFMIQDYINSIPPALYYKLLHWEVK